jgi:hypothetical protein
MSPDEKDGAVHYYAARTDGHKAAVERARLGMTEVLARLEDELRR